MRCVYGLRREERRGGWCVWRTCNRTRSNAASTRWLCHRMRAKKTCRGKRHSSLSHFCQPLSPLSPVHLVVFSVSCPLVSVPRPLRHLPAQPQLPNLLLVMNRNDRKVLSDRNQRSSLPRRNLFRKTRSSDQPAPDQKTTSHRSRSRSQIRVQESRKRGHENKSRPCTRYRPERSRHSSETESSPAKRSSPVKPSLPKSWAEMNDGDDDELWQLLTPESLDSHNRKTQSAPVDQDEDTLTATPRSLHKKKMTVEELLDTPRANATPVCDLDVCFKTPISGGKAQQAGRSGRNRSGRSQYNLRSPAEMETDMEILKRRQKDLDYGKNTIGYQNYVDLVPKGKRRSKSQPRTPDKFAKTSRRSWDQQVKLWRRKLHAYDPTDGEDQEVELSDILSDMSFDSKITFGDLSSPVSSAFPPSSPVSFLAFDDYPPLSSEGNLTDPDYDPAHDKESDLLADMDEAEFLS